MTEPEAERNEGALWDVKTPAAQRTPRATDPLWDALIVALGHHPRTRRDEKIWGRAVSELLYAGAAPDEIIGAAAEYRKEWPAVSLTIHALIKWFSMFAASAARKQNRPAVCPECEMGGGYHLIGCTQPIQIALEDA